MRNLKRALSLTLASVMLLGMMVIGTSAASYPDVDKDNNVEAIEVLQAVGVMQGDDKGNFDPDRTVSRNEMAIVMAKLLNLDYNYYSESCPFWDVPDYAKPYVGACYANGIVSGYNATTFGGADTVTAVQAASMMMRALGYFQYESDYKDGFVISTVRQASKIGLFKDINASQESALTRDQVAQLALNTLETGMVEAQKNNADITIGSGDTAVTINGAVSYVYVTSDEKYAKDIDDVQATSIGTINDSPILELGEKLYEGKLKKFGDKTKVNVPEIDDMGRPAVRWVYENKDVGTYVKDADLKFSYTAKAAKGDMYTKISPTVADDLRTYSGVGKGHKYNFEVYVDGAKITSPDAKDYFEKNSSSAAGVKTFTSSDVAAGGKAGQSGNGVLTEVFVIDGNPDTVRIVMTNTYLLKATADYNSTKETVNVEPVDFNTDDNSDPDYQIAWPSVKTTISSDDFNVADVKEDDYLLATWSYQSKDYVTVEPAELVSGSVTEYTVTDYVIMDGTKYSYNKMVGVDEKSEEFSINQDAKVVLDQYGYIIFVDEAISTNSFVYIQDVAGATNLSKKAIAAAYFGDGTTAEIELKKVIYQNGTSDGKPVKAEYTAGTDLSDDAKVHGWYTYIKDSDGKYTLTEARLSAGRSGGGVQNAAVAQNNEATQIVFNNKVRFLSGSNDVNIGAQRIRGNANTVFLTLDDDEELNVATGVENAPDVFIVSKDGAVAANKVEINWVEKDGYAQYVFIDVSKVESSVDSANSAADWLFILKDTGNKTVVDGDTYYKFKVVIDGEETERFIEESNVANKGELRYNVKTNSKDYITKASLVTNSSKNTHNVVDLEGSTIGQKGKTITIAGQTFIIGSKSELNLVVGKGAKALLNDSGADYELYKNTTAGTIKSLADQAPAGKGVDGKAYVIVDEAGSEEIEVLWVYIDGVSTLKTEVEEGSNSTDIGNKLDDPKGPADVAVTNPNLTTGDEVPAGKNLILKGDVSGSVTISGAAAAGDKAAGKVELKDANVKGDLTLTAPATLSGAVSVAAGKTLTVADAKLNGTISLTSTSALTITGDLTKETGAKIEADAGAQMTVPVGQTAALKAVAGKFYNKDGSEITGDIPAGTYVYKENWTAARMARATGVTGWVAEGDVEPGPGPGEDKTDISALTVTPAEVTLTVGQEFPTVTLKGTGIADAGITGVWAKAGTAVASGAKVEDNTTYTLDFTLAAKDETFQVPATLADEKIPAITGAASKAYASPKVTYTFNVGTVAPAQKHTVTVTGLNDWTVGGIDAQGYEKGATVTITLTQKTGADMAKDAKYTVTSTGATGLEGTVTKAGVAHADAVPAEYQAAGAVNSAETFATEAEKSADKKLYKKTTADGKDTYTAVESYDSSVTEYFALKTAAVDEVAEVKGEITITFTMPAGDVSITAIAPKAAG